MADQWDTIHAERKALAADLGGIGAGQWDSRSLCHGWTVKDVLGHMTATARLGPGQFFPRFVGAGFSLARMQSRDVASFRALDGAEVLSRFEAEVNSAKHPPGPGPTWLGEAIIHSADIRRPLGIAHDYPVASVVAVADFYKKTNMVIPAKKRIAGLKLVATDTSWSTGDGPEVEGPVLSLLMAMTGRKDFVDDLAGAGVALLRGRD